MLCHFASTTRHSATRSTPSAAPSRTRNGAVGRLTARRACFTFSGGAVATPAAGLLVEVRKSRKPIACSPYEEGRFYMSSRPYRGNGVVGRPADRATHPTPAPRYARGDRSGMYFCYPSQETH